MNKTCSTCNFIKPLSSFYRHPQAKDKHRGECKSCILLKSKDKLINRTPEQLEARLRWKKEYNKSPKRKLLIDKYNLAKYGITIGEYNEMLESQSYSCLICYAKHNPDKKRGRLYVDHVHATGRIRGLLCSNCNTFIGLASEDKDRLLAAINYLLKS